MQKWEYCRLIFREGGTSTRIRLQMADDAKPKTLEGNTTISAGLKHINKLGEEGWELVNFASLTQDRKSTEFLFKRLRQE